jgi:hypothetical protein
MVAMTAPRGMAAAAATVIAAEEAGTPRSVTAVAVIIVVEVEIVAAPVGAQIAEELGLPPRPMQGLLIRRPPLRQPMLVAAEAETPEAAPGLVSATSCPSVAAIFSVREGAIRMPFKTLRQKMPFRVAAPASGRTR